MEIMTFILSVTALSIIFLMVKSVLKKDAKDFKISFGFFKGFEFSCSFFEKHNTENQQ